MPCSACAAEYLLNTVITLTASPANGSAFAGWSGACSGTGSCTVTMDAAKSVTATFNPAQYTLTLTKAGAGSGTVGGGSSYAAGAPVALTATADAGSSFAGWSPSPCAASFAMPDEDLTCTATFTLNDYTVTATAGAGGSIDPASRTVEHGATTTFTIAANAGYSVGAVTGCGGTLSGTTYTTGAITGDCAVSASFAVNSHALTLAKAGTGSGTVTSAPAGINCGSDCNESYDHGTAVALTASPAMGSTFAGWSGACTGTGTGTGTVDAAKSATASFALNKYALTVAKAGAGQGTVTSAPTGINCGADCGESYNHGTAVTLTATATAGSKFTGWSGACTGTAARAVSMTAAKSVTATFVPLFALTVTKVGLGAVTSVPAGINCGTDCGEAYPAGTGVTLTATPAASWQFAGWTGACTGTGTCTVAMTAAKSVTATFKPKLTASKVGLGTVTSSPAGINCGTTCAAYFPANGTVTLAATPAAGWQFAGWTGACTGTGTCTVAMTAAKSVTAT